MRSHTFFNKAFIVIVHIIGLALLAIFFGQSQIEPSALAANSVRANNGQMEDEIFLPFISDGIELVYYDESSVDFVAFQPWDKREISYFIEAGTDDLAAGEALNALQEAFAIWQAVEESDVSFVLATSSAEADIVIRWDEADNGNGPLFDGRSGRLAHAFAPPPNGPFAGDIYLDDAEQWTIDLRDNNQQPIDLVTVFAHEIGRALGLPPSSIPSALMYPLYNGSRRYVTEDDVNALLDLYPPEDSLGTPGEIDPPSASLPIGAFNCSIVPETANISLAAGTYNSNWMSLTLDKEGRSQMAALEVKVNGSGGAGNVVHIVQEWSNPAIATFVLPAGPTTQIVEIPAGSNARLQVWVENVSLDAVDIDLRLCSDVAQPPTPTPTAVPAGLDCSTPAETATISLAQGSFGSDWKPLTLEKAVRDGVKAIDVKVNSSGGAGNIIHIVEEWSNPDIVTVTMPDGPTTERIDLPAGSDARLQLWIENVERVAVDVELFLCFESTNLPTPTHTPTPDPGGPTPTPTFTPTPPPSGGIPIPQPANQPVGDFGSTAKKSSLPPADKQSDGFGEWPSGHLIQECITSHDQYWVYGPDGDAYHTWHPVTETITLGDGSSHLCEYGHEHGSNPYSSPIFELFGGWPAFGYLMAQQPNQHGHPMHRHEDHVGHKVNVASFDAAKGQPQQKDTTLEDAGFDCHFISKIHQGAWSNDAITNHLHEYYVAAACDDSPQSQAAGGTTWFSVKRMTPFGSPNTFVEICPTYQPLTVPVGSIFDFDGVTPLVESAITQPPGSGNREFQCWTGEMEVKIPSEMTQPNLWTGETVIQTGTGSVNVAPYYVVKNASRILDKTNGVYSLQRTIDYCYDDNGNPQFTDAYCTGVPQAKPAWDDPSSPFNGTLRAVNFKRFQIYNNGGNSEICTDYLGNFVRIADSPTACDTAAGEVYQAVSAVRNDNTWSAGVNGSLSGATPHPSEPGKFIAPGIGFEHLETHDHPSVRGRN